MMTNLVNRHDMAALLRPVFVAKRLWKRLLSSRRQHVKDVWSSRSETVCNWNELRPVVRRWNTMISGSTELEYWQYVDAKFLAQSSGLLGLSLGCGDGTRELQWGRLGRFRILDAYDVSESRIAAARRAAREQGCDDVVRFQIGDAFDLRIRDGTYDVVLVEHALHHFSPLRELLERIVRFLKPSGYFVINEFVGPNRFQWTDRQVEAANALLRVLPSRLRRRAGTAGLKSSVFRPSVLRMVLSDPSEAVESSRILPLARELFDVLELREYGGAVLHPLLAEIAHNFSENDPVSMRALQLCFDAEDLLLESGEVSSDFVLAVCRPKEAVR
jgi:ubiquinone/menaquinone biosynthesis C-methylase UbiE